MLELCCFSDTHGYHDEIAIPDGDVLICCGDIAPNDLFYHYESFYNWFSQFPHKHKIFVPGNHDLAFENDFLRVSKLFNNIAVLINQCITINGINIYGTPYQPYFNNWAFNVLDESKRKKIFDAIPRDLDVLITHCPPYGILDKNIRGEHCGDSILQNILRIKRPKYHIFGHIHQSYGQAKNILSVSGDICDIVSINCSILNDDYAVKNKPIKIII